MRVLLIGNGEFFQVGAFFRKAIINLGHKLRFIDESAFLKPVQVSLTHRVFYHVTKRPATYWKFNQVVLSTAAKFYPELVIVVKGSWISYKTLSEIKRSISSILVNYATDDPFNPINLTTDLIKCIPLYDLYFSTKRAIMKDLLLAGGQQVEFLPFAYEPDLHFPERLYSSIDIEQFSCDVNFIGAADRDRYPIIKQLISLPNLNNYVFGGDWNRYPDIKPYCRGTVFGRDYRLALGGTKIALCLTRRANRDGHAMRSFEIPACGAFMLAERTEEHLEFFDENKEFICFASADEMLDKINYYLKHDAERQTIAQNGYHRVINERNTYKDRMLSMIKMTR